MGTKAHENVGNSGRGRSQGVPLPTPENFQGTQGTAMRGHLCDSTAFLLSKAAAAADVDAVIRSSTITEYNQ